MKLNLIHGLQVQSQIGLVSRKCGEGMVKIVIILVCFVLVVIGIGIASGESGVPVPMSEPAFDNYNEEEKLEITQTKNVKRDTIYRDEAIEAIDKRIAELYTHPEYRCKNCHIDLYGAKVLLTELPSANKPNINKANLIEQMEAYRDKHVVASDYWKGVNWAINTIRMFDIEDRPKGKWIKGGCGWKCSECTYGVYPWNNTNFCPNCGTEMETIEDEYFV